MISRPTRKRPVAKQKTWDFDEWFEAQHGKCPSAGKTEKELDGEVCTSIYAMHDAELKRDKRREWEGKRTSARYAWNIKDKQKTVRRKK